MQTRSKLFAGGRNLQRTEKWAPLISAHAFCWGCRPNDRVAVSGIPMCGPVIEVKLSRWGGRMQVSVECREGWAEKLGYLGR